MTFVLRLFWKSRKMECCNREGAKNALKSLGKEQLSVIINEDKKAEIVCPYCNSKYNFSEIELKNILMELKWKKEYY